MTAPDEQSTTADRQGLDDPAPGGLPLSRAVPDLQDR